MGRVYDKYAKACYEYERRMRKVKQAQKEKIYLARDGEKIKPVIITEEDKFLALMDSQVKYFDLSGRSYFSFNNRI